jgi:thiol-disulfide isomerase/thioredoxin
MKGYNCLKNLFKPRGLALLFLVAIILSTLIPAHSLEGFEGNKELLLLHMNGCGHCEKLMPEWQQFTNNNNTNIKTRDVEMSEDPSLMDKYKVNGFPTILLLGENGKKLDTYDGPRTADGLLSYCNKHNQ